MVIDGRALGASREIEKGTDVGAEAFKLRDEAHSGRVDSRSVACCVGKSRKGKGSE